MSKDWRRFNPFRSQGARETQQRAQRGSVDKALISELQQADKLPLYDTVGRQLEVGDGILFHPPFPLIYQIVSAAPNMDPKMPRGVVQLQLVCQVPLNAMQSQPLTNVMLVARHGQPLQPVEFKAPTADPAGNGTGPESASKIVMP